MQKQIDKLRNDLIENNNNNLSKNSFNTFLNKKRTNKIYLYESIVPLCQIIQILLTKQLRRKRKRKRRNIKIKIKFRKPRIVNKYR